MSATPPDDARPPPDDPRPPRPPAADAAGPIPLLQLLAPLQPPPLADVAVFAQHVMHGSARSTPITRLAVELRELIEAGHTTGREECTFELDVPGFGPMEGRVSIRRGQADLELHALRPAAAAVLRERMHQIQRMVDRESGADVNLSIV